uniref:EF-hand domain-containing protein n=1 Tax=Caenorhabditis tropicalis TaxID=1561998 RepID=A0A1I7TUG7_9PELO
MRTLRYAINRRNGIHVEEVGSSIDRLAELLETKRVGGELKEDEFLKLMMETTRKCPWRSEGKNQVTKCLVPYFKRCFPDQSITEILQNLDPEASLFIERRWAAQLALKDFPEPNLMC